VSRKDVNRVEGTQETLQNLISELKRGTLVLCVLSQLKEPQYGYSLVQRLSERGLAIEQGTLYPLLRRLEKQDLLESDWTLSDNRPRRYYKLSAEGDRVLRRLRAEWYELVGALDRVLNEEETGNGTD
jgi:PadR family transcriptional regulator PadR